MPRCFLSALLLAVATMLPSPASADLIVDFAFGTDVVFNDVGGLDIAKGEFQFFEEDGGSTSYQFYGSNELAVMNNDFFRFNGSAGRGANPIATIIAEFDVVNPTGSAIDLSLSLIGTGDFSVLNSPNDGSEYSANATFIANDHNGNGLTFALYNKTVTMDFSEGIDWPSAWNGTLTIPQGFDGSFSISSITETSGGVSVPEPGTFIFSGLGTLWVFTRRKRS